MFSEILLIKKKQIKNSIQKNKIIKTNYTIENLKNENKLNKQIELENVINEIFNKKERQLLVEKLIKQILIVFIFQLEQEYMN